MYLWQQEITVFGTSTQGYTDIPRTLDRPVRRTRRRDNYRDSTLVPTALVRLPTPLSTPPIKSGFPEELGVIFDGERLNTTGRHRPQTRRKQ